MLPLAIDDKARRRIRDPRVHRRLADCRGELRVIPDRDLQHVARPDLVGGRLGEQVEIGRRLRAALLGSMDLADQRQIDLLDRNRHVARHIAVVRGGDRQRGRHRHMLARYPGTGGKHGGEQQGKGHTRYRHAMAVLVRRENAGLFFAVHDGRPPTFSKHWCGVSL
jgi:hypothetical protein